MSEKMKHTPELLEKLQAISILLERVVRRWPGSVNLEIPKEIDEINNLIAIAEGE